MNYIITGGTGFIGTHLTNISIITVGMNHLNYLKDLLPSVYNNITPPYLKM